MWFYDSPDNYVHEFLSRYYKYLVGEVCAGYKWKRFYQLQ